MKIFCHTLFDITQTGIKSYHKQTADPSWQLKRNQQRNWETMLQLISLRVQPMDIEIPVASMIDASFISEQYETPQRVWRFSFTTDVDDAFVMGDDCVGRLVDDSACIPIITGLTETATLGKEILTKGTGRNVYFETSND